MVDSVLISMPGMHSVSEKRSNELPRIYPAERKMKDEKRSVTQQVSIINAVFLHLLSQ